MKDLAYESFRRLSHIRPSTQIAQAANALLTTLFCRKLDLIHVVEHPKCGGSWVRNMLEDYRDSAKFRGDRVIRPNDVVQAHRCYRRSFARPVVVVRDPRDMFVSFYYHETKYTKREESLGVNRYFQHDPTADLRDDFLNYLTVKLTKLTHPKFSYRNFVDSWVAQPNACLVRYEDLLEDCRRELLRILDFANLDIEDDKLTRVINHNSFAQETARRSGRKREPGEADPTSFQRKGIAGDWRNHFNLEACQLLQHFEGGTLSKLGYEKNESWIDRYAATLEVLKVPE